MSLSPNQAFMLKMFADGWAFRLFNNKRGSWTTYWSLRRRGLITPVETIRSRNNLIACNKLTYEGRKELEKYLIKNGGKICGS